MKFKYIYIVIVSVLFLVYLLTIPILKKQKQYIQYLSENYDIEIRNRDMYKNILAYTFEKGGKYESDIEGKDEKGKSTRLSQMMANDSSVLIFKYKNTDCTTCIDSTYRKLKSLSENQRLIIISDFSSFTLIRNIRQRFPNKNIQFLRVTSIDDDEITPSVYLLNHQFQITNFLYIAINDKILRSYINLLNKRSKI